MNQHPLNLLRRRLLQDGEPGRGPVVYWMSREQRVRDNWALLEAQDLALTRERAVTVVFCLARGFLGAGRRQFSFMLAGLEEVCRDLKALNISFRWIFGDPGSTLPGFLSRLDCGWLLTDFDPLRIKKRWTQSVLDQLSIPVYEVDAHNVVPCWEASNKREFAARTFRPKLQRRLSEFLEPYTQLIVHPYGHQAVHDDLDRRGILQDLHLDQTASELARPEPGSAAAERALRSFLAERLHRYAGERNDPNADAVSGLSPYFHFGQLSPHRAVLEVSRQDSAPKEAREAFIEEALVRRELSDNFCEQTEGYDSLAGLPDWGRQSLEAHREDIRDSLYSRQELEEGQTHDKLWNAAQMEMVRTGKMHGYLRMYWAKKILEWTESPEEALSAAIALNDRYQLDGRDPNGYTGIMWSIGGLHDRPFAERKVFGKIRFMSYAGCTRKFDVQEYIRRFEGLFTEGA